MDTPSPVLSIEKGANKTMASLLALEGKASGTNSSINGNYKLC
jgi:hypothetical protein